MRVRVSAWTTPRPPALATGLATDRVRRRRELLLENAVLRLQVLVRSRAGKRPALTPGDRRPLVLLASRLRTRASALLIVQPATVLRWHRQGFRLFWRRQSAPRARPSPLAAATIARIGQLARDNPRRGAERIRGALLERGIRVSTRTIQEDMRAAPLARPRGRAWATFLRHHAHETWACDSLQVTDRLFRPLFACFVVELGSRRVVHVGVTRHPTDAWVAQQLREATPYGARRRFLVRDNDAEYGPRLAQLAAASGIAARFLRSVRRVCRDHVLLLGEAHLRRVLGQYVASFNQARPHQGLGQRVPIPGVSPGAARHDAGGIVAVPVLGGLHHTDQRAA